MNSHGIQRASVLAIVLLSMLTMGNCARLAFAGNGKTISLPRNFRPATNGLTVQLSWKGTCRSGLRPVHVTFRSTSGPLPRDREIRVDVGTMAFQSTEFVASKSFTLKASTTMTTGVILVPERLQTREAQVTLLENGRRLRDLSTEVPVSVIVNRPQWHHATSSLSFLVVDFDVPRRDTSHGNGRDRAASNRSNETGYGNLPDHLVLTRDVLRAGVPPDGAPIEESDDLAHRLTDQQILMTTQNVHNVQMVHPADVEADWLALSGIDIVIARFAELQRMKQETPNKWGAIRF